MSDSDSDWDTDFIGGAVKQTQSKVVDYSRKNWRKKDDTVNRLQGRGTSISPLKSGQQGKSRPPSLSPLKSDQEGRSRPSVSPLKRKKEPLTSVASRFNSSPNVSPLKTTCKALDRDPIVVDDSLNETPVAAKKTNKRGGGKRSGGKKKQQETPPNPPARGRRGRSKSKSAIKEKEDSHCSNSLTQQALSQLNDASARAATMTDDLDDTSGDFEVIEDGGRTTPTSRRRLSVDDLLVVKVRWKYGKIVRIQVNKSDRLGVLMDRFCSQAPADLEKTRLSLNGRTLERNETCISAGITVTSFVDAAEVFTHSKESGGESPEVSNDGRIELKIQSSDRKNVEFLRVRPNDRFEVMMTKYAEKLGVKLESIRFMFDGEKLNGFDTPEDLDLEGGECIDAHLISSKSTQNSKSRRSITRKKKPLPAF